MSCSILCWRFEMALKINIFSFKVVCINWGNCCSLLLIAPLSFNHMHPTSVLVRYYADFVVFPFSVVKQCSWSSVNVVFLCKLFLMKCLQQLRFIFWLNDNTWRFTIKELIIHQFISGCIAIDIWWAIVIICVCFSLWTAASNFPLINGWVR